MNRADIQLPECPVCGAVLTHLASNVAGERAVFSCGATAYKSFWASNEYFEWTKSCSELLAQMSAPPPTPSGD